MLRDIRHGNHIINELAESESYRGPRKPTINAPMFVHYLSSEPLSCYLHQTDFPCLDFVPVFSIFCNSNGWISFTPSLTSLAFHVQCFDQLTKTSEITQKGQGDTSWAKHIFWELLPWFKQKTSTIVHIAIWYFTTLSPHLSMNYKTLLSLLTSPSTVQKQNVDDIGQEKKNKKKNLSEKEIGKCIFSIPIHVALLALQFVFAWSPPALILLPEGWP